MSNRNNPKRGESRRTEHGPRWESKTSRIVGSRSAMMDDGDWGDSGGGGDDDDGFFLGYILGSLDSGGSSPSRRNRGEPGCGFFTILCVVAIGMVGLLWVLAESTP